LEADFTSASANMAMYGLAWLFVRSLRLAKRECKFGSRRMELTMLIGRFSANQIAGAIAATLVRILPAAFTFDSHRAFHIASEVWGVWAVWWLAMAFFSKSTKRRETFAQRIEHIFPATLGFLFIFNSRFAGASLARRIFPDHAVLMMLCVMVTILGLLFALWARLTLGSNWSGTVTIKKNHQLIRRGPYRWIRHPIYTGMLAALLATVVAQGSLSGLLGVAFVFLAFYRKAKREESFLAQEFGEGFTEHRQHTGMFLPRFS
jgi:protein-S-isoprenylcysteine O-methyltransferase Ste14